MAQQLFSSISGRGTALFTGGTASVLDLDVGVNTVPPTVGWGVLGPSPQVRHLGIIGMYYTPLATGLGTLASPGATIEVGWWDYVEFLCENKVRNLPGPFAFNGFFWQLVAGAVISVKAEW